MTPAALPSSAFLAALPDGEEKRRFILDCTGCHLLNATIAMPGDTARTAASRADATTRMLDFAGPSSSFPVIGIGRDPAATGAFLAPAFDPRRGAVLHPAAPPEIGNTVLITEYPVPQPQDLPHDLAITADGKVLITGMFTHRMHVLDPATAAADAMIRFDPSTRRFTTYPLPTRGALIRHIAIDPRNSDVWAA